MSRRPVATLLAVVLAVALTGCDPLDPGGPTGTSNSAPAVIDHIPAGTLDAASARVRLAELAAAVPGGLDGYARDCEGGGGCVFGQPWLDVDRDGCDQRSQVLARDLVNVVRKPGRCAVTSGTLNDPYSGQTLTTMSKMQIDHVVPLAEMWRTGAAAWPLEQRTQAANNLGNLLAVQGKANQQKSDQPPDAWMPPNTAFHCAYARIYVTVKAAYRLTVTHRERDALTQALTTCG